MSLSYKKVLKTTAASFSFIKSINRLQAYNVAKIVRPSLKFKFNKKIIINSLLSEYQYICYRQRVGVAYLT